jgi:hypothetical protein
VNHVTGMVDFREMFVSDNRQPLLFVGALRVVAVFAIDDENGTFDAAEKLYGLR